MTNLTRFEQDGLELVIDTQTGEAFASIRAVARMCDRNESSIRTFTGARNLELKSAEILTPGGLQGARLLTEDQILDIIAVYKPELVKAFAKLGLRASLHQLAGYTVTTTAIQKSNEQSVLSSEIIKTDIIFGTDQHNYWSTQNNIRMAALFEAYTAQKITTLLLDSPIQPLTNGKPVNVTENIHYEGAVDVSIRLGFNVPKNYEGSLGTFVKKQCSDLIVKIDGETVKDYRMSAASNKLIGATMYPAFNEQVESAVRLYCTNKGFI